MRYGLDRNSFIYSIILLLVFFIPSASTVGGFQLWYVIIMIIVWVGLGLNKIPIDNFTKKVGGFLLINFCLLIISLLFSVPKFGSLQDLNELIRLIASFGMFSLIYSIYHKRLDNKTAIFLKVFLIIQLVFCYLQGYDGFNRLLSLIWNTDRIWALRRTGSFANPNILSIFSIAAYSYIFFRSRLFQKIIFGLIVFLIILFTSSKTGLISFSVIVVLNYFLIKAKFSLMTIIGFGMSLILVGYAGIRLLYIYGDDYPYLAQITSMLENDMDISQIKSIGDRQVMWDNALEQYKRLPAIQKIFGMGPAKDTSFNVIDNEFLTVLLKFGLAGAIFYIVYLSALIVYLIKKRKHPAAKAMISIVTLFLLASGSASTFMAWHLSLMLFLFLGICLKEIKAFGIGNDKKSTYLNAIKIQEEYQPMN